MVPPSHSKEECAAYVLFDAPWGAVAERFALADGAVERTRTAIHAWFRDRGRRQFTWQVAASATPADLVEQLLGLGARPDEPDPLAAVMVLTEEPPPVSGVDVRTIESSKDLLAYRELVWESFGAPEDERVAGRGRHDEVWAETAAHGERETTYVALVDGEIVAGANMVLTPGGGFLLGGNTRAGSRGRGLYHALVRARWDEAARRGTPTLGVHAGAMSRPILERLGFRIVSHVDVLADTV